MPFSTGLTNEDGSCECAEDYIWSSESNSCVSDCIGDPLSTGNFIGSRCECKPIAFWNPISLSCALIDCTNDMYSLNTPVGETSFCNCRPRFAWNSLTKMCEVDCSQASSLSTGQQISINQCSCSAGSYWHPSWFDCYRKCGLYDFTTGVNLDAEECICKEGYYWDTSNPSEPQCKVECGLRKGELLTYNEGNAFCDCNETSYIFSYELELCAINCNERPNTRQADSLSADTCDCVSGYYWDPYISYTGECVLGCDGVFDTGNKVSDSECQCEENANFDYFSNKCMVNCRLDDLSTKASTSIGCVCKRNAYWESSINSCACNEGFRYNEDIKVCESTGFQGAATIGAIAGVASTAFAMVMGKIIYSRRKKSE